MDWGFLFTALLWRGVLFALAWVAVAEGAAAPGLGAATALVTALASLVLLPPRRGGVGSAARFAALLPLLFWEAAKSGADVARRVVQPSLPVNPGFLDLTTGHGTTHPITLASAAIMNLMPGTLTVDFTRRGLHLHVIDCRHDHRELLTRMERRLSWVLGEDHGQA